jgi:hypothetical protein
MRATRSDSLTLDECFLPDSAAVYRSDDIRPLRQAYLNWFWGSYTPVYSAMAPVKTTAACMTPSVITTAISGARTPQDAPMHLPSQLGVRFMPRKTLSHHLALVAQLKRAVKDHSTPA